MSDLINYCINHKKIYCYGAGEYGRIVFQYLKEHGHQPNGFIVSKNPIVSEILGTTVYTLNSYMKYHQDNNGIIICVDNKYHYEIHRALEQYKLEDIVIFDQDDCLITGYADLEKAFMDNRKEPVVEITTLDFLNEEKQMIEYNISCYSDGRFISKAKQGYEKQFAKEQQKLVIVEKLIADEKQKMKKYEDRER